jgi:hypothetical protein
MVKLVTKDVRTGQVTTEDITEAEAIVRGIRKTQAELDAAKDVLAERIIESNQRDRAIALALVDMIYALRDGQLDNIEKPQAIQLLKQRVRDRL